jgi:hypothetical protein
MPISQTEETLRRNALSDASLGTVPTATYSSPTSPVISTDNLTSNPTPVKLPPTTTPTEAGGLSSFVGTVTAQNQAELDKQAAAKAEQDKINSEKLSKEQSGKAYVNQLLGQQTPSALASTEYAAVQSSGTSVDTAAKELRDINNQILAEQQANRRQIETLQTNGMLTKEQAQAQINELSRQSASKQADLAIVQLAKQGNYTLAKDVADRKINAELEQQKLNLSALQFVYSENKDIFTKDEQRQFESKLTAETRKYEEDKAAKKTLSDTKIEMMKTAGAAGAPSSVLQDMQNQTTPEGVITAAGVYGQDQLKQLQAKQIQANIDKIYSEIKANKEISIDTPGIGEYAPLINGASGLVANTKKQTIKTNIVNALANGNYETAYAEVANAVSDGLTGTTKQRFDDSMIDINVMNGMRNAIEQYTNSGGDLGFLKGTADTIAKKFGQLKTDPRFASLGVQLTREFQAYRNQMTGAAFTPQESKEYLSVNPRTNATLDLNLATIDGALSQLRNRVTSTINAKLPSAASLYQKVQDQVEQNKDPQTKIIDLGKSNPSLQPAIKRLLTQTDPALGRPLNYEEVLQILGK